jgi:hypothetical protein
VPILAAPQTALAAYATKITSLGFGLTRRTIVYAPPSVVADRNQRCGE